MADMDEDRLCTIVGAMVKDAENYRNDRSTDREKMMVYFDGDAEKLQKYIPADEDRSRVVSRDVRSAVRKVLPSILRTILGNDEVVEYTPIGEGDEASAKQAGDYVNYIALPECNGRQQIEDAINDAVRLRNGVLKWWYDEKKEVQFSSHSGLGEMEFAQLVADDEVEVLEHTERTEQIETQDGTVEVPVHDLRIKRTCTKGRPTIGVIAPENMLIDSEATSFEDAILLGENIRLRRSDLVKMGYDRKTVDSLPTAGAAGIEQDNEEDTRRRDVLDQGNADESVKASQEIDYYDLLVRIDFDGDGISELRRMVFAGGFKPQYMLENLEWDELNYANIISERRPHQWEGNSVTDEVMEVQKVKTVLLRQTLDNLYWQNNLQPIVQEGKVSNPDAILRPSFGKPIRVPEGTDVREAVGFAQVPMVADKSFAMLEYMDNEVTDRTGISDASSGMAPDALQNMTAKASAMIEQAGIGQTEMMVRCIADSLKPVFRGLLKLIIDHQDKPRTVRLRDEWVTFDPRSWNANMDAVVNIGLGAGTRERDMMMMQQVIGLQREILTSMGPAVGMQYVTPENIYNSVAKLVEAAGLKSVGLYFTEPDPKAIQQAIQSQAQQPSPEQVKAQTALQVEDKRTQREVVKTQVQAQTKREEAQLKAQVDANREREQRNADLATNMAEMDRQSAIDQQQIAAEAQNHEADRQLEREGMALEYRMHREDIAAQQQRDQMNNQANIQREQARSVGKAFEKNERSEPK